MVQKMPDSYALIRSKFRKILCDPVLRAEKALPHQQHDRRRRELLTDRSQLKDRVLRNRKRVFRIPEAESSLGHDLAVFRIEPRPVEAVFFLQRPGKVFHCCILIHFVSLHKLRFVVGHITQKIFSEISFQKGAIKPERCVNLREQYRVILFLPRYLSACAVDDNRP